MLTIKNKFGIGQFVHLITDTEKFKYLIIYIKVNPNGLLYGLGFNAEVSEHFEIEIEKTED